MKHTYDIGGTVFGKWHIERKVGAGNFGTVYEIRRKEFGETYTAALKVITVPQGETEFQDALDEGMTRSQAEDYFYTMVKNIVQEFAIMAKLKGTGNVVSYEDHEVVPHEGGRGMGHSHPDGAAQSADALCLRPSPEPPGRHSAGH